MRLGGISLPLLSYGWVGNATVQTALQELWGSAGRLGLLSVWKEMVMSCTSALSASPQGQRGRNCDRPPNRKSQSRGTEEDPTVNPARGAAVGAGMGLLPLGGQKWGPLPISTAPLLMLCLSSDAFPRVLSQQLFLFLLSPWSFSLGPMSLEGIE